MFTAKTVHIKHTTPQTDDLARDVSAINKIPIISQLLDVICRTTGMGFSAVSRVTEDKWVTCTSLDSIGFGLKEGDELKIETTMCQSVRKTLDPIFIDHAEQDPEYCDHPIPKMYGIVSYVSFPIMKKDGSFFGTLCAIDTKPVRVKTPEIQGMFKLFADLISFHLNALEEMDATMARLEEEKHNAELREQFIAILGHDLKNPVATTRMSAEILLKTSPDEMSQRHAKMIKSTSYRMEGLIDNILDFARGRLGEGIVLKREFNNGMLKNTLQQVLKEIKIIAPGRTIAAEINLAEPVNCDHNRIGQLFSNLLSNADTHGAEESPIAVEATSNKEEFRLSVTNAGDKIPESAMKHLFQPFYREDVKPGKQGLGLGLYITSEIARAHGGKMEVSSTEKETCFTFVMPSGI